MIWPVTLVASLLGLAIASIPGALLGMLVGSIIDRNLAFSSWAQLRERLQSQSVSHFAQQQTLFMLLGYLAKSTGRVTPAHIRQAQAEMQRLQLVGAAKTAAIDAFSQGKTCSLNQLRSSLRAHYQNSEGRQQVLLAGWRMAKVQGLASIQQRRALQQCADWLGCSASDFARYEQLSSPAQEKVAQSIPSELEAARRLLGVQRSDSLATIKTAYRRQLSLHHPDKLMGAGATPAQVQAATEKTRALHHAYALLRQRH